jgi:hypothetical protein
MEEDIKKLKDRVDYLEKTLNNLSNSIRNPRVQIENLEGIFKTLASAPLTTDYRDGALVLYDDGGTRKIYVKINGAFYSATIT